MIVAVGLFCGLVATTIRSEHADDANSGGKLGLSDDIKKILINYTREFSVVVPRAPVGFFPPRWDT